MTFLTGIKFLTIIFEICPLTAAVSFQLEDSKKLKNGGYLLVFFYFGSIETFDKLEEYIPFYVLLFSMSENELCARMKTVLSILRFYLDA